MKTLLTLALALLILCAFTGLSIAQEKAQEKKPAAAAVTQPKGEKQQITGEVTKVDAKAGTFTVKAKDVQLTLSRTGTLPEVGQRIKITIDCWTDADGKRHCKITVEW
jgi:Cu/Ag efflux protein CusF